LIIHLEALGAVLRATVVLTAIKRKWPKAHITWMTSPLASAILENNTHINRLFKNDHAGVLSLSALSFDYAFCIDKSLLAGGLLHVPRSVTEFRGFGVDSKSGAIVPLNAEAQYLFDLGLSDHEKFFVNKKPETQLIIESLGLTFQNDEYIFEFSPEEKKALPSKKGFTIGLNTGCSSTIPYKKFSVRGWIDLIDILEKDFPKAEIYLLGGPEDTDRNSEISKMRPSVISTPTTEGLRAGFKYLNLCDVVVTGDSLGMHMAIALKKWVVAWFGPTCHHEIDLYGRGEAVLTSASCSPCWKRSCDKTLMCYDQVDWSQVTLQIRKSEKVFAMSARKLPELTL
jgi:heptosyltransferase-2